MEVLTEANPKYRNYKKNFDPKDHSDGKAKFSDVEGEMVNIDQVYNPDESPVATGGGLDLDYSAAQPEEGWTPASNITAKGAIDPGTLAIVSAEQRRHGGSLQAMLAYYQGLAEKLVAASDTGASEDAKQAVADIAPQDLFTSLEVITTLQKLSNKIQGASTGTFYEVLIALLAGGVVKGADSKAADVLAGNKGQVVLSVKNEALKGDDAQFKSKQAFKNIYESLPNIGDVIWYIGFGKKTDSNKKGFPGRYVTQSVHITGIKRIDNVKNVSGSKIHQNSFAYIKADGSYLEGDLKSSLLEVPSKASIKFSSFANADFKIPIAQFANSKLINIEVIASKAIDQAKNETQIAIQKLYDSLDKLTKNTQVFLAQMKEGDTDSATETASRSSTAYNNLKANISPAYSGVKSDLDSKYFTESVDALVKEVVSEIKQKRKL